MPISTSSPRPAAGRRVVVTGIGAVSPNGVGREAFWEAVRSGRSGVRAIEEFDPGDLPVRIAGTVRGFDAARYVPENEQKHVARAVPMALAASEEALLDSGLGIEPWPLEERRRTAVVLGSGGAGLEFIERQFRQYYLEDPRGVSLYTIPSSTPGTLSTGCTSSTDALGHAVSLIRYGRADRALAGGADSPLSLGVLTGFCLMKILTRTHNAEPERASRPFSKDRDGFVLAEGAWMFVLEERDAAISRGARVYGEIAGYGATCEAFHRVRLDENGEEPARAMLLALQDAGIAPGEIGYVSLHGTSTVLNDRIETRAIRIAFGDGYRDLPASSLKSMIGHPQGACGAAGVAAALLAMRDGFLPPTINHEIPDPECDLDVIPNVGRPARPRAALCNTIGFGSKNAALVLLAPES